MVSGCKMRLVIVVHHHRAQSFRTKQQRIHGNLQPRARHFHFQVHLRVASRQQLAGFVGHIDFRQQRAGVQINGVGRARHCAVKFLSGILRQFQVGAQALRE